MKVKKMIDTKDPRVQSALEIINSYGGIDGAHHKQWVLDQVVRVLTGCEYEPREAIDANGKPYTYQALGFSEAYLEWVRHHNDGDEGPNTYEWDEGIAP